MKVGDIVRRVKDVGTGHVLGDMMGVVVRVTKRKSAGGVRAYVRVLWENGYEGTLSDRQVRVVERVT